MLDRDECLNYYAISYCGGDYYSGWV